jgi:predicted phosphate transport protein (TIGR00153 family)
VRLRLTPREQVFYDLFAASADNLVDGANTLHRLITGPREDRDDLARQLRDEEHRGDSRTHEILREVNSTFVTPFDREDIYRLAGRLDDVMDYMEAAGDLVVLYGVETLPLEMHRMVELLERAAEFTQQAMRGLRTPGKLSDYWIEVNRLENEADKIYRRLVAKLFSGEYEPLMVLKLKDIADELEAAADAFENVADTVETIAVKES